MIQKIGLCICLYDVLRVQDGIIGYGTGEANVNVDFRLIFFRPFKGEIVLGQISSASEAGMKSMQPVNFLFFLPTKLTLFQSALTSSTTFSFLLTLYLQIAVCKTIVSVFSLSP